jgi:hypothetical protein
LSFDAVWHTAGPIWRKEVIKELGGFDEELLSFQDLDLHVRALIAGLKHFKVSIRDHFYRMGRGHGNAIALRSSTDPDHLRSHERLFEKIETLLRTAGLLDTDARYELVGMYWWLATRYRVHVSWKEACRVWRKCYHLGLLSRRRYGEGLLVTLLAVVRGGRHLGRLVQRFWPAQYHQLHSKDFHTNPVSSLDGAVIWSTEFQAAGKLKGDSHVRNKSLLP